jgi:hypothetical protein
MHSPSFPVDVPWRPTLGLRTCYRECIQRRVYYVSSHVPRYGCLQIAHALRCAVIDVAWMGTLD